MTDKPTRRRLIEVEADGTRATYRLALRQTARATVFVNPPDAVRADGYNNPCVRLVVHPDGRWQVETHESGWESPANPWRAVARGHVTADGQHCDGDPDGYAWRFNRHARPDNTACPWSHVPLDSYARQCPALCPASDIEPDPNADAPRYDQAPDPAAVG